jgi:hypothetical protein
MPNIDPIPAPKLQPELLSGESIYWAGMPNPGEIFHSDDLFPVPFTLMWGGFAIFLGSGRARYPQFGSKPSSHHSAPAFHGALGHSLRLRRSLDQWITNKCLRRLWQF